MVRLLSSDAGLPVGKGLLFAALLACVSGFAFCGCSTFNALTAQPETPAAPVSSHNGEAAVSSAAPTIEASRDVDFGPYMARLQKTIKRNWFPPKGKETRRVQVCFKVQENGEIDELRLEKSSGSNVADAAALEAVRKSSPLNRLPAGAPQAVDIQFTFDYNVFAGKEERPRRL